MNISWKEKEKRKMGNFHFNGFWRLYKASPTHIQPMPTPADIVKLNFLVFHCEFFKRTERGEKKKKLTEFTSPPLSAGYRTRDEKKGRNKPDSMWNSLYPKHQRVSTTPRIHLQRLNTERGVLGHQHIVSRQPKRMKSEPRKKRKANVNETKNLSQTFLSRSTDKVLQPRIHFSVSLRSSCANTQYLGAGNNNKAPEWMHGK